MTHDVLNQVPPLVGFDGMDYPVFQEALTRAGAARRSGVPARDRSGRRQRAGFRARRPCRSASAGPAHPRPVRVPGGSGRLRPELSRAHDHGDPLRPARDTVVVGRRERPPRPRSRLEPLGCRRRGPPVSDHDDVRRRPGPARGRRACRSLRRQARRTRIRPVLSGAGGEDIHHRRHVDDGEAGRLRRPGQHDDRGCAAGRHVPDQRPQVVYLGADVGHLPDARQHSSRRHLFRPPPRPARRHGQRPSPPAAQATSSATTRTPAARWSTSMPSAGGSATKAAASPPSSGWSMRPAWTVLSAPRRRCASAPRWPCTTRSTGMPSGRH